MHEEPDVRFYELMASPQEASRPQPIPEEDPWKPRPFWLIAAARESR